MKTIGVVRYYGFGNYGDELFADILSRHLYPNELVFFPELSAPPYFRSPNTHILDGIDGIIVGGGDLMIPWVSPPYYFDSRWLQLPTLLYNIGVPTWGGSNASTVDSYRKFANHPNCQGVIARDENSAIWMRENLLLEIDWYPDMAFCDTDASPLQPRSVVSMVMRAGQVESHYEDLLRVLDLAHDAGLDTQILIAGIGETALADVSAVDRLGRSTEVLIFSNISGIRRELSASEFVVADKFHAIVTALAAGRSVLRASDADKFVSLMPGSRGVNSMRHLKSWSQVEHCFFSKSKEARLQDRQAALFGMNRVRLWVESL